MIRNCAVIMMKYAGLLLGDLICHKTEFGVVR
jgi:hypothetical protein